MNPTWDCPDCEKLNWATRDTCEDCGALKPSRDRRLGRPRPTDPANDAEEEFVDVGDVAEMLKALPGLTGSKAEAAAVVGAALFGRRRDFSKPVRPAPGVRKWDGKTMPFGKYKDSPVEKVPLGYIGWILDEVASGAMAQPDPLMDALCRSFVARASAVAAFKRALPDTSRAAGLRAPVVITQSTDEEPV